MIPVCTFLGGVYELSYRLSSLGKIDCQDKKSSTDSAKFMMKKFFAGFSFFEGSSQLTGTSRFKDSQVIVFENKDPDIALIPHLNYQHFTKSRKSGRYGFFPLRG